MSYISDNENSSEFQRINTQKNRTPPMIIFLSISVFIMAGLNLAAGGYMYGIVDKLQMLDDDLQRYRKWGEQREKQLVRVSTGFTGQLVELENRIADKFTSSAQQSGGASDLKNVRINFPNALSGNVFSSSILAPESFGNGMQYSQPLTTSKKVAKVEQGPPIYKRIEDADGRVFFKKQ